MEAAPPRSARHAVLVHHFRLVQAKTGPLHPLRRAHHRPLSRSSALTHGEQPQPRLAALCKSDVLDGLPHMFDNDPDNDLSPMSESDRTARRRGAPHA